MPRKVSDEDIITAIRRGESINAIAKKFGIGRRNFVRRVKTLEARYGITLENQHAASGKPRVRIPVPKEGYRSFANIRGTVLVGSDGHFWPGERSKAFDAFITLLRELKPKMVVMNGDCFDGARISRHAPSGFQTYPEVHEELDAVKERLAEIECYAPKNCPLVFPAGNHDTRFTARLAQAAPEYAKVPGADLADHFPSWQFCWSLWINDHTVIKHRWHNGIHSAYNNTVKSGKNIVSGHTHKLHSVMFADYNGVRWGVECGTLSEYSTTSDKFSYTEDNPANQSQGFAVLSFEEKTGMLLEPEFCRVINGQAYFRGERV